MRAQTFSLKNLGLQWVELDLNLLVSICQNESFCVLVASHALPSGSKFGDWTPQTYARLLKRFQSGL